MKQAIILRSDVDMSRGKAIAQGAHASVLAVQDAAETTVTDWIDNSAGTKIALAVSSEDDLRTLIKQATDNGLPARLITDLGRTEIEQGTTTAGAIGPAPNDDIDAVTGQLSLY